MANITSISAEPRDRAGKGAARATRRAGRVPAVIYGNKQESSLISLEPVELMHQINAGGFFSKVFEITINDDRQRALVRDVQLDPVTDAPIHVDFMRFSKKTRLVIDVPCSFINEEDCPGLRKGGVLNIVRHTIELRCSPDSIPESIEIDLGDAEVGDSIHISAITLPGDVELTITDRDFTVATIAAPTLAIEDEPSEEEGEGEGETEGEGEDAASGDED